MPDIAYWLIGVIALSGASLLWRRKRQYDRTNKYGIERHGSYWKKLRADGIDTVLLGIGYGGLFAAVVIMVAIFDELISLLILILILAAWLRSNNRTRT